MEITIKDVARLAGVSTATVSYVLNDSQKVSAATRAKVLQAVSALNYTPNTLARGLVGKKVNSIAVIVSTRFSQLSSEAGLTGLLQGIGARTYKFDYSFSLLFQDQITDQLLLELRAKGVEGLILVDLYPDKKTNLPFPTVICSWPEPAYFPYWTAFQLAFNHLAELGKNTILFLIPNEFSNNPFIENNVANLAAQIGIKITILPTEATAPGGYVAADKLTASLLPEAFVTFNDNLAIGVLRALTRKGLQVPVDIALVSCNDDPPASYAEPPLTTVRMPWFNLGERAVDLLIDNPQSRPPILPKLVIRESCGSLFWV